MMTEKSKIPQNYDIVSHLTGTLKLCVYSHGYNPLL